MGKLGYGVSGSGPVTLGASGGASGDGGAVTVTSSGAIMTSGAGAHGILAQTIGGGGGFFQAFSSTGGPLNQNVVGSAGAGSGGDVTVNVQAFIQTTGPGADGVIAQSVGGGGGLVGGGEFATVLPAVGAFAGSAGGPGSAGAVTIDAGASVIATGLNSIALVGQSVAPGGQGDIHASITNPSPLATLTIQGGTFVNFLNPTPTITTIEGGGGQGAGITFIDGVNNVVDNAGHVTSLYVGNMPNYGDYAVRDFYGLSETVNNTGWISGSVDLGSTDSIETINMVNNKQGAVFDAGTVVWVGPGNSVNNLISPGSFNNDSTTDITGNLSQSSTGMYGLDLNLEPSNDLINVSGTAAMSGNVFVNLINPLTAPGYAIPGTHQTVILAAQGGETHPGLTLIAFDTAAINYTLTYPGTQDIDLQYVIDYSPGGLTQNQHSVGNAVNLIQTLQLSPAFGPIATNLFYLPNVATLGAAYDSLSGEGVSASEQTAFDATDYFLSTVNTQTQRWIGEACGDDAMSKTLYETPPAALPTRKGEAAQPLPPCAYARTWRIWGTGFGGGSNWPGDAAVGSAAANDHTAGLGAGLDYQVSPNALLGVAAGGGASSFGVPDRATSGTVDAFHAALYGAWRNQGYYANGILSYDQFSDSEARIATIPGVVLPASNFIGGPYVIPGFGERPTGNFRAHSLSGYGEIGYEAKYGILTATPFAGLEFASLNTGAFTENNQGLPSVIGLSYASMTTTSLPSYLGLQIEAKGDLPNQMGSDVWARGAWKHEFDPTRSTQSSFISAPGFDFAIQGAQPPHDAFVTSVGLKLNLTKNAAIFGTFEGEFGSGARSYGGTGGLVVAW